MSTINCLKCKYLNTDTCINCSANYGDLFELNAVEKQKNGIKISGIKLPTCCVDCRFFEDDGDYPCCRALNIFHGYNFDSRHNRMKDCPIVEESPNNTQLGEVLSKQPLKGKWEDITKPGDFTPGGDPIGRCPFCKDVHSIHDIGIEGPHWNFCPMCGAELK